MDELNTHLKEQVEMQARLAGAKSGVSMGSSSGQREIDPDGETSGDIVGAGLGVTIDRD